MDVTTFLSEVIKAVVWPVTLFLLVLMLRRPIIELLPSLRHLKYKEFELKFSEEIKELKTEAKNLKEDIGTDGQQISPRTSDLLKLVTYSPRVAIMEAWIEVESAAATVASAFWSQPPSDAIRNMPKLGEYLLQCKVIEEKQLDIFNKLRQLRNKAAHAGEFGLSESDARTYVELASNLANHIRAS